MKNNQKTQAPFDQVPHQKQQANIHLNLKVNSNSFVETSGTLQQENSKSVNIFTEFELNCCNAPDASVNETKVEQSVTRKINRTGLSDRTANQDY